MSAETDHAVGVRRVKTMSRRPRQMAICQRSSMPIATETRTATMPIMTTSLRSSSVRGFAALVGAATLVLGLTAPASAATPPPRPTSLTAHGSGARHWLGWAGQGTKVGVILPPAPNNTLDQRTNVGYIVQQARNTSFTQGVTNYRLRGPGRTFTPYLVSAGTTYYFRVRAVSGGLYSGWSNRASFLGGGGLSTIRVASYNS